MKLLGFSQRHLFWCSLMCFRYTIDEHTSCRSGSDQLQNQARFCKMFSLPHGSRRRICPDRLLQNRSDTAGRFYSYGIIEPIEKILVVWEVSNGGIGTYSSHQEIYFKGRAEDNNMFTFSRELSYYGTHLLRCKISNAKKGAITRIFKVVGV